MPGKGRKCHSRNHFLHLHPFHNSFTCGSVFIFILFTIPSLVEVSSSSSFSQSLHLWKCLHLHPFHNPFTCGSVFIFIVFTIPSLVEVSSSSSFSQSLHLWKCLHLHPFHNPFTCGSVFIFIHPQILLIKTMPLDPRRLIVCSDHLIRRLFGAFRGNAI
uniref:Uncharacterized protein n=1 Tax=Globodera rostochiensis TaxID=31243 RepID=A0A914I9H0_GLORO